MKNRVVGVSVGLQGASAGLYGGQGASVGPRKRDKVA